MRYLLFYIVILLANVIQGITGFAGTILAMPFSLRLVGMETAVPVLNVLGMASGLYVTLGYLKSVDLPELKRVLKVMGPALIAGILIRTLLSGRPGLLYRILGVIVLLIAIKGLYDLFGPGRTSASTQGQASASPQADGPGNAKSSGGPNRAVQLALLVSAGLVHGMFVCGGPLLIGYLAGRLPDKARFRATISTVWIFLDGAILISQLISGMWTIGLLKVQIASFPFLLAGMYIGGLLFKKMDQRVFMILTYVLLLISSATLFFK